MALQKKYINTSDSTEERIVTKLYLDQYNDSELQKAVDFNVSELVKPLPQKRLDLVPRSLYDNLQQKVTELQGDIISLNVDLEWYKSENSRLDAESGSLYNINDNLNLQMANLENRLAAATGIGVELRTNLTTSLVKAINEATERTALEAENNGLTAQKNALIKQIDTLNNLLAQANASLQVAQQQLSAKAQAVAAGGVATGELSTIVFDIGDVTKSTQKTMIMQDYNGGPNAVANKFTKASGDQGKQYVQYFDLVAGPKDISVDVKVTGGFTIVPWDFGFTIPATLKANETKRFAMTSPNTQWVNKYQGNHGASFFSRSSPTGYEFEMSIIVKDMDTNGKTENKNFTGYIWKH